MVDLHFLWKIAIRRLVKKKKEKEKKKISVVKPGVVVTLNISAASSYGEATHKKGEQIAE